MCDQHRPLLLLVLVFLCLGCRKDRDEQPPTVRILSPQQGFSVTIPDTFTVEVEVSDDRMVRSLVIGLTDVNGVPIGPMVSVNVDARSATVVRDVIITDERIESGTYTLMARASDGTNDRKAFVSAAVQAAPLRLRAVYITPAFGSIGAVIQRIDSTGAMAPFTTVQDLNGASVDSYSQHVLFSGSTNAPLAAIPTNTGSMGWQVGNLNAQSIPYFIGLKRDPTDGRHYFSTNDGFIRGYSGAGSQTFTGQALSGFRGWRTVVVGEWLVCAQRSISLPEDRLVGLALASGTAMGQFPLDLDVVDMYRRTDQHALIFGNRSGSGWIQDRNVVEGGGYEPREFTGSPISATLRLDANTWVIALPGQLLRYAYATNSVSVIASGFTAQCLAHESATGTLYAGVDDQLILLDPFTGTVIGSNSIGTDIGAILPLLNR